MTSRTLLDVVFPAPRFHHLPALTYHDGVSSRTFSYADIIEEAQQISQVLLTHQKNGIVALDVKQSQFLVPCLILSALVSHSSFIYLDPENPVIKQKELIKISKASVIVTDYEICILEWKLLAKVKLFGSYDVYIFCEELIAPALVLSKEWRIAYLVSTSGTTGQPKIVRVPESCILPNILDLQRTFAIQQCDVIFAASPFTFDPSIVDLFLAFSTGAKLLLVKPCIKAMPAKIVQIIQSEGVTFMQATPSFFLQFGPELSRTSLLYPGSPLRTIVLGGEPFPALKTLKELRSLNNTTEFYNIYGITEVSCWAMLSKIDFNNEQIDLGHCLSETDVYVSGDDGEVVHQGEGTLMLGGRRACLLNDEMPDSLQLPLYRSTGDRVEIVNGKFYYRGRLDETVKRMGKRLNLHSVELMAIASGLVHQCYALLDCNQFLILACSGVSSVEKLIQHFRISAAPFEQPDEIHEVDSYPVSKHGKVDRKKLLHFIKSKSKLLASSDWKAILRREWSNVTGQNIVEHSNFILSGGNSLAALRIVNLVEESIKRPLPLLLDILLNKTWKELINYIQTIQKDSTESLQPAVQIIHRYRPIPDAVKISNEQTIEMKQIWKYNLKKCIDASPLIIQRPDGGVVFIGSHSHLFSAIKITDGEELWTTELPDRIESSATSDPSGNHVFVGCYDGNLYCLDAFTGRISWQYQTEDAIKSSPLCTGSYVLFGSHDRSLYALSVTDGQLHWRKPISSGSLFASPSWNGDDRILCASLDGTCSSLSVSTGELLWTTKLSKPVFASPAWCCDRDRCLFASVEGFMRCCSAKTGEVFWDFQAGGPIFSTPVAANCCILFGSHDNFLYCLDERTGVERWRAQFLTPVYSTPFVTSFIACSNTSGNLRLLDFSNGRLLAETQLDGEVFSSPVVTGQYVVIGCRDDYVYCFQLANQQTKLK